MDIEPHLEALSTDLSNRRGLQQHHRRAAPWGRHHRGLDHPNVTAVLHAGLPGQESKNAIVDVLFADSM
jgi:hypothetical protein